MLVIPVITQSHWESQSQQSSREAPALGKQSGDVSSETMSQN